MPILVSLGLSVFELGPMYMTDRCQTDRRQTKASLNASALWEQRHNNPGRLRRHWCCDHQWLPRSVVLSDFTRDGREPKPSKNEQNPGVAKNRTEPESRQCARTRTKHETNFSVFTTPKEPNHYRQRTQL